MKFTVDVSKYRKRRKNQNLTRAFQYQLQGWTGRTIKHIIRRISGPILKTRTGQLRRSVAGKASSHGTIAESTVGSGIFGRKAVKYAKVLEKGSGYLPGGKIRPKRAKALTIPLPGVKGKASNYPNAFLIKSKAGNTLLVERRGAEGIRPLFVLKKSVKIPAFHWLSDPIKEMTPDLKRSLRPAEIIKVMARMGG